MVHRDDRPEPRRFRERIRPGEALAIDPQALDAMFVFGGATPNDVTEDGIAIVSIEGPLEHHHSWMCDNYEDILVRVEAAMCGETPARAVILCIDSPGGEAAGSMYCHRKLRSLRKKHNIPLYAYANECAASAAYAIASACDEIWLPDTATVGSIGVIATMFDRTSMNEKTGLEVKLITSGAYKADGHADRPLTDDIESRMQKRVDALAGVFFEVVAKRRRTSPKAIAGLEAGVFIGQDAVDVGLADGVERWDRFLRLVAKSLEQGNDPAAATAA